MALLSLVLETVLLGVELFFSEVFRGVVDNSLFNLYDPILKAAVDKLFFAWQTALSHDQEYDSKWERIHVFTNPLDLPLPKRRQERWDEIERARMEMRAAIDEILARLRADYVEIDLHRTNEDAWKYYWEIQKEVQAFGTHEK